MRNIGIVFAIDKLADPLYGQKAFKIIVEWRRLKDMLELMRGCLLWAGDLQRKLPNSERPYCFCIEVIDYHDTSDFEELYRVFSRIDHPALPLSPDYRFIYPEIPPNLVHVASVSASCDILPTEYGQWVSSVAKEEALLDEILDCGRLSVVERMLSEAATVNASRQDGTTALMLCAWNNLTEILKLLLDKGANIDARNDRGDTAFTDAMSKNNTELMSLLPERGADVAATPTALPIAAGIGNIDLVRLLLNKGCDINTKDKLGVTALMRAVEDNHTAIVHELLANDSDIHARSVTGWTALMCAASKGRSEIVDILVEKGAEVDAKADDGSTALLRAAKAGHADIVLKLLNYGADVNCNR